MKNKLNKKIIIPIIGVITILGIIIIKVIDIKLEKQNTQSVSVLNIIETDNEIEETEDKIIIYITGEVKNQGVYELEEGSRIADAIEAAGGTNETANLKNVNLAYELQDGEKVYIPNINEETEEIVLDGSGESETEEKVININKADSEELQKLNGIGETTAENIIKYREENGKFETVEDLLNVPGIGEAKLANIKDQIKVK